MIEPIKYYYERNGKLTGHYESFLLDLVKYIKLELTDCGIVPEHIEHSGICTYENEEYTSYRRCLQTDLWEGYIENKSAIVMY